MFRFRPLHSLTSDVFVSLESTDGEDELVTEDDRRSQSSSQWSPTEGDAQSQWSRNEDDLDAYLSATKEEQSKTEEEPHVAIPQDTFGLPNICNLDVIKQVAMAMRACAIAHSPDASNSSSPPLYEYIYGSASVIDENIDQHLQFRSIDILDYEAPNLIDLSCLLNLGDMIPQCQIVEPGNLQILYPRFVLDSSLYDHFISAGLTLDKWTCMNASEFTCQSANDCAMVLKIAARLYCLVLKNLDEAECESFGHDLRDQYFKLYTGRVVGKLIEATDSISNLKWPASHIYQMLVLYKVIDDVLRVVDCPSQTSDGIVRQMRENFKGIFDGIESTIREYLNDPQDTIIQVVHPVTNFLVRCMELFASHSSTVQDTCIGSSSSSLVHRLDEMISYWVEQLNEHFISYHEGRNYILLLNNLTHFYDETMISLQELIPSSEPNSEPGYILKSLMDMTTWNYLMECWVPVRDCVVLIPGVQPCWTLLIEFTIQFNIVYNRQKMWVLKTQLKRKLRKQIEEFLVPYYNEFLEKLPKRTFSDARLFFQKLIPGQKVKYMTTEELRSKVQGMFETEHNE